jgi:hypothetical protein
MRSTRPLVLNDYAKGILSGQQPAHAKQRSLAVLGVDASGESAQTRADARAMAQREVNVDGRMILCDWHTKLRPHRDRIYFNATAVDQIVIGIFHEHLD